MPEAVGHGACGAGKEGGGGGANGEGATGWSPSMPQAYSEVSMKR